MDRVAIHHAAVRNLIAEFREEYDSILEQMKKIHHTQRKNEARKELVNRHPARFIEHVDYQKLIRGGTTTTQMHHARIKEMILEGKSEAQIRKEFRAMAHRAAHRKVRIENRAEYKKKVEAIKERWPQIHAYREATRELVAEHQTEYNRYLITLETDYEDYLHETLKELRRYHAHR